MKEKRSQKADFSEKPPHGRATPGNFSAWEAAAKQPARKAYGAIPEERPFVLTRESAGRIPFGLGKTPLPYIGGKAMPRRGGKGKTPLRGRRTAGRRSACGVRFSRGRSGRVFPSAQKATPRKDGSVGARTPENRRAGASNEKGEGSLPPLSKASATIRRCGSCPQRSSGADARTSGRRSHLHRWGWRWSWWSSLHRRRRGRRGAGRS